MGTFDVIPKTLLREWISIAPGSFSAADLSKDVDRQILYTNMLEEFVKEGVIDRHGIRRGWYIPRHTELEKMDFMAATGDPVDIWLPFALSDYVELYDNSVVVVSGSPNAGKTAILLNIINFNRYKNWDIHYFNSEMSASELKKRLLKFNIPLEKWNFQAYSRAENFQDVIFPGKNCLNIIDFLEVHDEFYIIGQKIKQIHDRLQGGIAVIAIQKNPGSDTGLGGYRTMEVARLALSIDYGSVKVTKAKNFRKPDFNPNGLYRKFNIIDGCELVAKGGWLRQKEEKE